MIKLKDIVEFLDNEFNVYDFNNVDYNLNGLVVKNSGNVGKIGVAVDCGIETFYEAKKNNVDMLITHHGLFSKDNVLRLTGSIYEKIKVLIDNDIALYSVHIPLDVHSIYSNNRVICDMLNWDIYGTFANHNGFDVGVYTDFNEMQNIDNIISKLKTIEKNIKVWGVGDYLIKRAGIISGNGIKFIQEAKENNIDLLITGESSHKMYWHAYENSVKCIFLGHYAMETYGIIKLGKFLSENFNTDFVFIDLPTGE